MRKFKQSSALPYLFCPTLWHLSSGSLSFWGLKSISYKITTLAGVRFIPKPPAKKKQEVGDIRRLRSDPPPWSQHPNKLSGSMSCETGDIILSICLVTKMSWCDFKSYSISWQVNTLPSFVLIGPLQINITYSIRHVTSQDQVNKESWLYGWELLAV